MKNSLRATRRRGLTLMELVVFMAILTALASILIPLFPNLLRRAHKSVDATQTSEVAKAIQFYQGLYVSYPDNFDLLLDGTGAFPAYLPFDGVPGTIPFGQFVKADVLTQSELDALNRVGIKRVQPLATTIAPNTDQHPTRFPYPLTTIAANAVNVSTATATKFAVLDETKIPARFLENHRNADPTARYVVFGIGPRCSMVGQNMQDAPMSVPQKKDFTPDTTYSRVGVIFKVSGIEVQRTERARFIAAVALEDDELELTEKDIVGFYEVSKDPSVP
jgi:type II secretory pathway pseudopilin PulG